MGERLSQSPQVAMLTTLFLVMAFIVLNCGSTISLLARREHPAGDCYPAAETYAMVIKALRKILLRSGVGYLILVLHDANEWMLEANRHCRWVERHIDFSNSSMMRKRIPPLRFL